MPPRNAFKLLEGQERKEVFSNPMTRQMVNFPNILQDRGTKEEEEGGNRVKKKSFNAAVRNNAHLKRLVDQQDPMEELLKRITKLKFVNSGVGLINHTFS